MLNWLYNKITSGLGGPDVDLRVTEAPHAPTEPPAPVPPRFEKIANRFTDHAPTATQITVYKILRRQGKELGFMIEQYCPESDEKKTALTRLDEAVMHANAAIARHS